MVDLYGTILHEIYWQDLQFLIISVAPESYLCQLVEQMLPNELYVILSSY
jgi:hypothetical protein